MTLLTADLLRKVARVYDSDGRRRPSLEVTSIPTLELGFSRPISPQLAELYRFASRWERGMCGQTFLSVEELADVPKNPAILDIISTRTEHWPKSAPAILPRQNISLLSVNVDQTEPVFLIWNDLIREPSIVSYVSNYESEYRDLNDLLSDYSKFTDLH